MSRLVPLNESIWVAGQIAPADIGAIAATGITGIVNNRPDGEEPGQPTGGEIETAVREVRAKGLLVISLNMAGSVPDAADLVVTDPVQAGVMAVMAVADTAKFDLMRQLKRRY